MKQVLVEGLTCSLNHELNFPWAKKLSLAKKIRLPTMKSSPAQKECLGILKQMKKKKKPPIVNRVNTVPQTSKTYRIESPEAKQVIRVLMLQKEKISKISHIIMKTGQSFKTSSRVTRLWLTSSARKTKAVTQKMWPTRKERAPSPKAMSLVLPQRRNMSPADPKRRPAMMVLMCLRMLLITKSSTTISHTGIALVYLRKLSWWSASPMRQSTQKTKNSRSKKIYHFQAKKGLGCQEYIDLFKKSIVLYPSTKSIATDLLRTELGALISSARLSLQSEDQQTATSKISQQRNQKILRMRRR